MLSVAGLSSRRLRMVDAYFLKAATRVEILIRRTEDVLMAILPRECHREGTVTGLQRKVCSSRECCRVGSGACFTNEQ